MVSQYNEMKFDCFHPNHFVETEKRVKPYLTHKKISKSLVWKFFFCAFKGGTKNKATKQSRMQSKKAKQKSRAKQRSKVSKIGTTM